MKNRFRMYQRKGVFYVHDSETGKQQSLGTRDKKEALRLHMARNEAQDNRLLNLKIAEAHMAAHDPAISKRTWQDVIDHLLSRKDQVRLSTLNRMTRAYKSTPFDVIRDKKLVETVSEDFLKVLSNGGTSTNLWLRVLHNKAYKLDWILRRVLAEAAWPSVKYGVTRAITKEQHERILAKEKNLEKKLFYDALWHTGGSPVDVANLTHANIDWDLMILSFHRQKLNGEREPACIQIGTEFEKLLRACPPSGCLFPKMRLIEDKNRASEFRRRCRTLKITGIILYSYRYAWAERAKTCGYPERFAMANLGHSSMAIHRAYARKAKVVCPSLEEIESQFQNKKIVKFNAQEAA